jgi:hypothetical protein
MGKSHAAFDSFSKATGQWAYCFNNGSRWLKIRGVIVA